MPRETEIRIPLTSKTDRNGDEYWVTERLGYDVTINLNDWIGLAFIPPEGQDQGEIILKPRRKELNLPKQRNRRENGKRPDLPEDKATGSGELPREVRAALTASVKMAEDDPTMSVLPSGDS